MEYSISARISNRHVHLTKELYDLLFDVEMTKKNDTSLKQNLYHSLSDVQREHTAGRSARVPDRR